MVDGSSDSAPGVGAVGVRSTAVSARLGQRWSGHDPAGFPDARDWRTQASAISALLAAV
jgi:hypothetical protein